ncbi:MAG: nicotinate-nucleotide adenylyltransferase [Neomegalonema sp.]|nr:nicotinate-nucleotide adenylyltransferase [Neomegalonema sp.]
MRIGLLGGSFDPPHAGHVHITEIALRALQLDQVWWLVTPGNPLKPHGPAALERRVAACRQILAHPRVRVTDIEAQIGARYTADTIAALRQRYRGVRFVWLMGADNLRGFHRWERWDWIAQSMPMAVLARPGEQLGAALSKTATRFARFRVEQEDAAMLPFLPPPAWCLLTGPMSPLSSTQLRRSGIWASAPRQERKT